MPSPASRSSSPAAPASNASAATRSAAPPAGARTSRRTKAWLVGVLAVSSLVTQGCYLTHLASGQWRLLRASRPIAEVLEDPATDAELRASLELVERTRAFARGLGLEVSGQYTSYVAWPGDRVVTTVVAAAPGTLEPHGFWFPIVGSVPYRGYFDVTRAEAESERLSAEGFDVCQAPVRAYSTLGWFDDPVTGPMLAMGAGRLVETLLHELVHATVFVASEPDFNEGVAQFFGEEASVRFYADAGEPATAEQRRREVDERHAIDAVILELRDAVASLYAETEAGPERQARRAALEAAARTKLEGLPLATRDPARLAEAARLNDACLAISATYTADRPAYTEALRARESLEALLDDLVAAAEEPSPRETLLGNPRAE